MQAADLGDLSAIGERAPPVRVRWEEILGLVGQRDGKGDLVTEIDVARLLRICRRTEMEVEAVVDGAHRRRLRIAVRRTVAIVISLRPSRIATILSRVVLSMALSSSRFRPLIR